MGSDAMILSPEVEVLRDKDGELLEHPQHISVLSCAAPMIRLGLEGRTESEYQDLLYHRICSILKAASYPGYRHLVLGAFGCGVFGNDARIVSQLFKRALEEYAYFENVVFAILCRSEDDYNFDEFRKRFVN